MEDITVDIAEPTNTLNAMIMGNPTIIPMNLRNILYNSFCLGDGFSGYIDNQTMQLVYNFAEEQGTLDNGIWTSLADICGGQFSFNWLIKLNKEGLFNDDMWHYASCKRRFANDPAAKEWLNLNPSNRDL